MPYNEATQHSLDLWNTAVLSIRRELTNKQASACSEQNLLVVSSLLITMPPNMLLTENSMKKMYSTIHFPPTLPMPIALPHSCQSAH